MRLTFRPRLSSRQPIEAAANPMPREDTTPPVTKMYLAIRRSRTRNFEGYFARALAGGLPGYHRCAQSIMAEAGAADNAKIRRNWWKTRAEMGRALLSLPSTTMFRVLLALTASALITPTELV